MEEIILKPISEKNKMYINNRIGKELQLFHLKETLIKFGFASAEVEVKIDEQPKDNEIHLSSNIISKLRLPLVCNYNLSVENNNIIIGPLIGIVVGTRKKLLFQKLRLLNNYVRHYSKINGSVFGFTIDGLNREDLVVEGLLYNPQEQVWETRTLPYPNSIIKRGFVNQKSREYLHSLYGESFFNYKAINKWNMHQRLSQFEDVQQYLPSSELYVDVATMNDFLTEYRDIYVKPIGGNQGLGIYNCVQKENYIEINTRKNGENIVYKCNDKKELQAFASKYLTPKRYIMQKTLDLKINNRVIDFRVGLDKNQQGNWQHKMFITRVGGEESIVSNVASGGGYVDLPINVLKNIYSIKHDKAKEIEEKLLQIAYKIANRLDQTGIPLGKIALDLSIDNNSNIYLIEVNNRSPNDNLMSQLGDYDTFYDIKLQNILYAKGLAGFPDANYGKYLFAETENKDNHRGVYELHILIPKSSRRKLKEIVTKYCQTNNLSSMVKRVNNRLIFRIKGKNNNVNKLIEHLTLVFANEKIIIGLNTGKSSSSPLHHELSKKINYLQKENFELKENNGNLSKKIKSLTRENRYIRHSKSWKVTAPFRGLVSYFKR